MSSVICDTLIVGAGAAGLAAAWVLSTAGHSVTVLEARHRIGGRIWSRGEAGLAIPAELGAEFIHGRSCVTFSLLDKAGLAAVDAGGSHWTTERGRLRPSADFFAEIGKAMKAHKVRGRDIAFERLLDRTLRGKLSEPARAFARLLVEGFDAAEPALASARAIVEEWTGS
ncbi:MAG TPA: FAD-dependent oxidoreductase, partial [Burkholderiales bacterium]|nr:FAD-dependent oxidoreductase [Burkholderiales bacterium]